MDIFKKMEEFDYEQLVFFYDKETGLKGITCIHNTTLGPALGGTRIWNYASEDQAITDVLRLARGMTYKNAAAGLNLGGGKTVLIGDADQVKSEAYFRAFGRFVQSLNGRYITAEDVNTCTADMDYVKMETDFVTGLANTSGDPSPFTALGVYYGMKASCKEKYGTDSLKDKVVAIQGVGHVGYYLCKYIAQEGGKLIITDIKQANIDHVLSEIDAQVVAPDDIYSVDCDIFAPCALGAVINDETIEQFRCDIIAGASNNVLKEVRHGDLLTEKGILYAPDYVINAGGVINVYQELLGYDEEASRRRVKQIYDRILDVYQIAKDENIPTYKAADRLAEKRIETIKNVRSNYILR